MRAQSPVLFGDLIKMRSVVPQSVGAASIPVRKSIRHLPRALPIAHIDTVQGPTLETDGISEKEAAAESIRKTQRVVLTGNSSRTGFPCSLHTGVLIAAVFYAALVFIIVGGAAGVLL